MFDWMHCFNLGVCQFVCGNVLYELLLTDCFGAIGGAARIRFGLKLRNAFGRFKRVCNQRGLKHSQPMFTWGRLGLNDRPGWPIFKSKAANCFKVLKWLNSLLQSIDPTTEHDRMVRNVVQCFHDAHQLMFDHGMYFRNGAEIRFRKLVLMGFLSYAFLAREAVATRVARWQLKPKHHALDELSLHAYRSKRNPRSYWCFKHEDYMGVSSRITSRAHPSTVSVESINRWLLLLRFPETQP